MRASGVSSLQLLSAVGLAGLLLAVLMVLLGESAGAVAGRLCAARCGRARCTRRSPSRTARPTWLREGDRIVSLRRQAGDLGYGGGVLLFELGPDQSLKQVARADSADLDAANRWVLSNYAETSFDDGGDHSAHASASRAKRMASTLTLLELSVVRADLLDTPSLDSLHQLSRGELLGCASLSRGLLVAPCERLFRGRHDGARVAVRVRRLALGGRRRAAARGTHHGPHVLRRRPGADERRRGVWRRPARDRVGADGVADARRRSLAFARIR